MFKYLRFITTRMWKGTYFGIFILSIFVLASCTQEEIVDPSSGNIDFFLTLHAAKINQTQLFEELDLRLNRNISNFAKADILLVKGRLLKDNATICKSIPLYEAEKTNNLEEQALIAETIASLDCSRDVSSYLMQAAKIWKKIGNQERTFIDEQLAKGINISFQVEPMSVYPNISVPENFSEIGIGNSKLILNKQNMVIVQTDRFTRDWLSGQIDQDPWGNKTLITFSERLTYSKAQLDEDVGWHEGGRARELKLAGINVISASATLAVKKDNKWYGSDENGVFRFEIPLDKISYPTTRFLREDIAVLTDTHGINMMVEQALRNNVTAVIACCDHPGKIAAAIYLSERNISSICLPDKFVYLSLGHDSLILGSPPLTINKDTAVFGNRKIVISKNEKVVVMNATDEKYALWYYQTPASYFSVLSQIAGLKIIPVTINNFGEMNKIVETARKNKINIIGARVFNENDYLTLKSWLDESKNHRVILFHSAPYPSGIKLFQEFPLQTSFDDPNPVFV